MEANSIVLFCILMALAIMAFVGIMYLLSEARDKNNLQKINEALKKKRTK